MKGKMFVYDLAPIDFWDGWNRVDAMTEPADPGESLTPKEVKEFLADAQRRARKLGWEGDVRDGPFWAPLPNLQGDYWPVFMVAWKQDNNGRTFLASPFDLPWLRS